MVTEQTVVPTHTSQHSHFSAFPLAVANGTIRDMDTPNSTSHFNTPARTRSATLTPSPSASPSPFANSQPQCIHDIGAITAQLLSEDDDIRTKCLALVRGRGRCEASFKDTSRPKSLVEAKKVLLGTAPISAEKVGKFVMRILFCRGHNEARDYKRLLGCFYEKHQSWTGGNSPAELEFLRAIRQVFNFSLVQSPEDINTTPVRLACDIPLRPAPPTICDATCPAFDLNPSMSKEEKEGATCEPEVRSQSVMADAGGEGQGGVEIQESLPVKNAIRSDHQPQLDEDHVDSETVTDQADREVTATTVYLSADIFSLSTTGLEDLKSGANGGQKKELTGCKDIPGISVCNEFVQTPHASRTTRNDALPSPSPEARSQEPSLVTERFFELDREERDTGLCRAEGSPKPEPTSGRKTRNGTPAHKSVNANERIRAMIKEAATKEGYIYILKAPQYFAKERPGQMPLVKIGMSVDPNQRMKEIKNSCGIEDLERVLDTEDSSCRYYYKIEKLVHDELANYARGLVCTGGCRSKKGIETEHTEWFAVSETVALQTVQRWRRFMDQNPYDGRGILKDVWSKMIKREDFQREEDEDCDEHEKRHRYWTRWLDEGIRVAAEEAAIRNSSIKAAESPIIKSLKHLISRLLKTKLAHGFRLLLGTLSLGF